MTTATWTNPTSEWKIVEVDGGWDIIDEEGDVVDGAETRAECEAEVRKYARHYEAVGLVRAIEEAGHGDELDRLGLVEDECCLKALRKLATLKGVA